MIGTVYNLPRRSDQEVLDWLDSMYHEPLPTSAAELIRNLQQEVREAEEWRARAERRFPLLADMGVDDLREAT